MTKNLYEAKNTHFQLFPAAVVAAILLGAHWPSASGAVEADGSELRERFAKYWTGAFSNERQARAERLNREPDYPEAVRLVRDMRVHRLNAPAIGDIVLFLEEVKADRPQLAHRQRDRSIKVADGAVRGEIDGFSWLRFDRLSDRPILANGDRISRAELRRRMPLTAKMEGVWEGTFRRVGPKGEIIEALPSRIIVQLLPDGEAYDYRQISVLNPDGDEEQRIESYGKWDVDRLLFFNGRLEGWAKAVAADEAGQTAVFLMEFNDGSGLTVSEVVSFRPGNPDARMRATQYMRDGRIVRRTLIDEIKVSGPVPQAAQPLRSGGPRP